VSTPQGLVETLLKEAVFLRSRRDYPLALAHLEQAVELEPKNSEAYRELGRTLSYFAAETTEDDPKKESLLDRAEVALRRALDLPGASKANCLHDLAWVYDERRDFENAIKLYREAQQANNRETTPPARVSEAALSYNLACALAKAGRHSEAVKELASVIKDAWKWAENDPDFAAIRESGEWGPRFRELIASGREMITRAGPY
jgi:tetratricopeptide (TPR) repeat protein